VECVNAVAQRIACLQPSATVILAQLGVLHRVVACTKWCQDLCPEVTSRGAVVISDSWSAKAEEIVACKPDLVIAAVPYRLEALAEILKAAVPFLGLAPKSLSDVYSDIGLLARIVDAGERGTALIAEMRHEIELVKTRASAAKSRLRVFCEEWGKPIINSQRWVAELVEIAGGQFMGEPGGQTSMEAIAASKPDVIITSWCGAGDRVPLEKIIAARGWQDLKAVREGRVYCISDEYLNTPAPTLVSGLRALASAIHPELFGESAHGLRRIALTEAIAIG
jgi:iron complex transport system substrate-binding protein